MEQAPVHASHLVERFGLFTLIVLGESVISVGQSAGGVEWAAGTLAAAVGGFLVVACLWWLYFEHVDAVSLRGVLDGLVWSYSHLPLLAGLVSVAVGTEFAVRQAATGELGRSTALALGGGTALYLLATVVSGQVSRGSADRTPWPRLGAAAAALAAGFAWPLGAPLGLVALLDLVLVGLVGFEAVRQRPATGPGPERGLPGRSAWNRARQGKAGAGPAGPALPTTLEAAMRYRVTWNVEVDAGDEGQARTAARQYLLEHEDEALSKVVALEEGSSPADVPKVDAGGSPSL